MFRKYRMNRMTYGITLAIAVAAWSLMIATMKRPPGAELIVVLIAVPRLHDIGRSGWWAAAAIAGELLAVAIGWQGGENGILIAGGLYVLFVLALLIALAFVPGQKEPNKWGDVPRPGFHFEKREQVTTAE